MDIIVIYAGQPKEKHYRVFPKMANDLAELLDKRKRFWEWEEIIKTQEKMIKAFRQRYNREKGML